MKNKNSKYSSLIKYLDKSEYSLDQDIIRSHCIDWRKKFYGNSELIVFPKSVRTDARAFFADLLGFAAGTVDTLVAELLASVS